MVHTVLVVSSPLLSNFLMVADLLILLAICYEWVFIFLFFLHGPNCAIDEVVSILIPLMVKAERLAWL
jgi:hypothetical protein